MTVNSGGGTARPYRCAFSSPLTSPFRAILPWAMVPIIETEDIETVDREPFEFPMQFIQFVDIEKQIKSPISQTVGFGLHAPVKYLTLINA